jgi:hypothetical protein
MYLFEIRFAYYFFSICKMDEMAEADEVCL